MKILSLFDGISCARVALERAGIPVEAYYASEIDKYAIQIGKKNWEHKNPLSHYLHIGDVKDISHKKFIMEWDYPKYSIDLLIGGSPCQDLSIAKRDRKGLDGERSGLFWEYVRILKEVKPKYFILENVASMPKGAKAIITEALGVEPIMINAALVSAQNRKRLFWTNIPNVTLPEDRGILLRDILEPKVDDSFYIKDKSNTIRTSGRGSGIDDKHNWDTIRIGEFNKGGQGDRIYSPNGKSVGLSALGGGRGAKTGLYAVPVALRNRGEGKKPEYNGTGKANAMTSVQTDSMVEVESIIRKLTPVECERLQGLPDNYTDGISNTQRYKCCGNAFNVDVVAHILSFIPQNYFSTGKEVRDMVI
jgi:DNA-cytosine methyltransferase